MEAFWLEKQGLEGVVTSSHAAYLGTVFHAVCESMNSGFKKEIILTGRWLWGTVEVVCEWGCL